MTPAQRALILHALGLTPRNGRMRRWSYRNHYCACVQVITDSEDATITGLVDRAWLIAGRTINNGRDRFYHVTRAGAEAASQYHNAPSNQRLAATSALGLCQV